MGKEFRDFIMRGNVVDLAVGIVIGVAFGSVITALVRDFITPLVTIPTKGINFNTLTFKIGGAVFAYGDFINVLLSFLIIAAVIFFFVVRPMNALAARRKKGEVPPEPSERDCPYCLSAISIKATRCAYCTSEVAPVTAPARVMPS
ncbi:MAG: large conductance mechanosensitive channel protein MscL [Ktedonobacterales bacterium]|nr:large conductance mechanosensitive channel protein MscL [Ktedonobacterales bacterium]